MATIVDTLRRLLGRPQATGVGFFQVGGGGMAQMSQSWDFLRIHNSVYCNPTGFRCINAITANFSRPPWLILPPDAVWPQGGSERALKSHSLLQLLNRPNLAMSGTMMQRAISSDLELCGKSFWMKMPGAFGQGSIASLRRLPTQRVTVDGNQDDDLLGFIYIDRNGRQVPALPEQVVYLRYPHPERMYDGMAPALIAGLAAETDTAGQRFNRELLRNDSAMPGYLILQGLTPEGFAQWKDEWEKGSLPGKTRFLSAEQATYAKTGQTNQELTYSELRQDSQDDVMRAFGVPRAVAFDVSHETYANAEREQALFMQHNILPKWVLVADELTLQLGLDENVKVAMDLAGIDELQDSRDAVIERATKLMGYQAQTINEFRISQGWKSVPWGDEPMAPVQPMSAVPLAPPGETAPPALPEPQQQPPPPPTAQPTQATAVASEPELVNKVYDLLNENYPAATLGWVREATWEYRASVPLADIRMSRRPGGRDPDKVEGIAEAVKAGKKMDPVVLVQVSDGLEIADGYHRTLGFKQAGRTTIAAYIGSGVGDHGPWEREMHDRKINALLGLPPQPNGHH